MPIAIIKPFYVLIQMLQVNCEYLLKELDRKLKRVHVNLYVLLVYVYV